MPYRTQAPIERIKIRIVEHEGFWRVHWTPAAEDIEDAGTAAEALASVKKMGEILAGHLNSIIVVEWEPRTSVGASVVRALQG